MANDFNDPSEWDPDHTLEALTYEQSALNPDESPVQAALRLFREALVPATSSICHLAMYSRNERIRADCAKYVVERNLGQLKDVAAQMAANEDDPLMALLAASVKEYEAGVI